MKIPFALIAGVLVAAAIIGAALYVSSSPLKYYFKRENIVLPIIHNNYILQELAAPIEKPSEKDLNIPDLDQFTHSNVMAKIPADAPGEVSVALLPDIKEMEKFSEPDRRVIFAKMQGLPEAKVIVVKSGVLQLEDVVKQVNDPSLITVKDDIYYLYAPLLTLKGATLIIGGKKRDKLKLRMSQEKGGFLVNAGQFFAVYADISGWNETNNDYAWYKEEKIFRPFFATWSGSTAYFSRSDFRHLGYAESKSYGITFSVDTDMLKATPGLSRPTGWIVQSLFDEVYYGFYSYEADDVALVGNTYKDNIVYGIDPHDRSRRLIIAYNEAFGTKKRHGIIVSREVNDSWIVHNYAHNNKGSGLMLDRTSVNNVVAYNVSEDNGSDGLTFFESQDNLVIENELRGNKKSGLRLRNSWNVKAFDNIIEDNGGVAVQVYAGVLTSDSRDLEEDPYTQRASVTVSGGHYENNKSGTFKIKNFESFIIGDVETSQFGEKAFRDDLESYKRVMVPLLVQKPYGVEIHSTNTDFKTVGGKHDADKTDGHGAH